MMSLSVHGSARGPGLHTAKYGAGASSAVCTHELVHTLAL